ncbi:MAG: aminotransferase class I/II-fold pyridoxal phosphate-dependent enzyme [Phycisphaerales bacterium]|nr:MAG: aminotransferase class I/II-fold pyridoxal phosphate-dependent enzyme [Phycisphaerales bacterium]
MLAERIEMMELPPFRLERFFAAREFVAPFNLCASDVESMSIGDLLQLEEGAEEKYKNHWLGYTETLGAPGLRVEIAKLYTKISADQVLVEAGGEEVIFTFMNAVLRPGDHVIVHYPCYQSLHQIASGIGCEVTRWEARAESSWKLDLDFLRNAIKESTRLVVINVPHNPTGFQMTQTEWREFIEIASARELLVYSDEAYRGSEYEDVDRLPAACDLYEGASSLGLMSKGYGLPGLRLGWLATRNADILAKISRFKDYTTICSSAPSEFLAELALRHGEQLLERGREIVTANLELLRSFFARHTDCFRWVPPLASPVTFPTLTDGKDVDSFCADLLEAEGVLLLPGTVFSETSHEFRMGMGRRNMPEALTRFEQFLAR